MGKAVCSHTWHAYAFNKHVAVRYRQEKVGGMGVGSRRQSPRKYQYKPTWRRGTARNPRLTRHAHHVAGTEILPGGFTVQRRSAALCRHSARWRINPETVVAAARAGAAVGRQQPAGGGRRMDEPPTSAAFWYTHHVRREPAWSIASGRTKKAVDKARNHTNGGHSRGI